MSDPFVTPRTVAHQTPLSVEFSRQEYQSGLPSPSPGNLLNPGIEPRSPALQADYLPTEAKAQFKNNTGDGLSGRVNTAEKSMPHG